MGITGVRLEMKSVAWQITNNGICTRLFVQDELEVYSFKSIFRCDAINTEKHFPSLLLLVCQSAGLKKPDIHFFNCESVKVSHGPLGPDSQYYCVTF